MVMKLGPKGYKSLTVKAEIHEALSDLSKILSKKLGTEVSLSKTIEIVTNFYVEQKEAEKPN